MDIDFDWLGAQGTLSNTDGFDHKNTEGETAIYVEILKKLVSAGAEINDA